MTSATLAARMLKSYPRDFNVDAGVLAECIAACSDCASACTLCADDCLSEQNVAELVKCIRLDLDCADVCAATGRIVSRQTEYDANLTRATLQACITACRSCGEECARHGEHGMEHCRVCAEECDRCRSACEALLAAMQ
jgi:hypothetical protein